MSKSYSDMASKLICFINVTLLYLLYYYFIIIYIDMHLQDLPRRLHACGIGSSVTRPHLRCPAAETADCAAAVPTAAVILWIVDVVLWII